MLAGWRGKIFAIVADGYGALRLHNNLLRSGKWDPTIDLFNVDGSAVPQGEPSIVEMPGRSGARETSCHLGIDVNNSWS